MRKRQLSELDDYYSGMDAYLDEQKQKLANAKKTGIEKKIRSATENLNEAREEVAEDRAYLKQYEKKLRSGGLTAENILNNKMFDVYSGAMWAVPKGAEPTSEWHFMNGTYKKALSRKKK